MGRPGLSKAWEAGYLQSLVPKAYGGPGKSQLDEAIVCEELAWGCAGLYTSIMANGLAITPILIAGSDQQKKTWLSKLVEAPLFAAFSLSEPNAGSDAGGMTCRAEKKGMSTSSTERSVTAPTAAMPISTLSFVPPIPLGALEVQVPSSSPAIPQASPLERP